MKTYLATAIINIFALLFLSGLVHGNYTLGKHRKKPFLYGVLLTIFVILSEIGTIIASEGGVALRSLHIVGNVLGFALTPLIPIVLVAIYDFRSLQKHWLFLLPSALNGAAVILSPLFGLIFTVDGNNHYERGDFFFIFVAVYLINLLFLVLVTLRMGKKYLYPIKWKVIGLVLFTVIGTCIQLVVPSIYSSWHCVTLALFLYYILLSDYDSSFDTLTGLYNRAAFEKASRQLTGNMTFSLIAMDLNDFKPINDTFGHDYGDTVLRKVAAVLRDSFDDQCACFRVGGDEFSVICRGGDLKKLELQIKSMTTALARVRLRDSCLPTIAYGLSTHSGKQALDLQKLLKEADDQMYYYKQLQKTKCDRYPSQGIDGFQGRVLADRL